MYKATTSQDANTRKAATPLWYAGIDWADQHHDAVVIDEAGQRVAALRVAHTAEGLADLTTFLKGIGDVAEHPDHLACSRPVSPEPASGTSTPAPKPTPSMPTCWRARVAAIWPTCGA